MALFLADFPVCGAIAPGSVRVRTVGPLTQVAEFMTSAGMWETINYVTCIEFIKAGEGSIPQAKFSIDFAILGEGF